MKSFVTSIGPILPLLGVIIGSLISFTATWYFTKRTDSRAIRQTAAQLAQYLDAFAHSCAGVISDNDTYSQSDGHAGAKRVSLPLLGAFPNETDLGLVEPIALSRLLSLKLKWQLASDKIQFWWDVVGDPECMPTETDQQCGVLGIEALEIAKMLRKSAQLPKPLYAEFYWDFSKTLHRERECAIKRINEDKET